MAAGAGVRPTFDKMAPDFRELSALIYHHINPYGIFELDLH